MQRRHVQAEVEPHEYDAFQAAARDAGMTLKEGLREAMLAWVRQRRGGQDPIFAVIGSARGAKDASSRHDDIYLED